MSKSEDSSTATQEMEGKGLPADGGIKPWWGTWQKSVDWRDKLYRKAAHKTLDIPDDDMQINSHKSGVGALGLIGVALAAGFPGAMLAYQMLRGPETPVATPTTPVALPVAPVAHPPQINIDDLNLKVRWWVDENGEIQTEVTEE